MPKNVNPQTNLVKVVRRTIKIFARMKRSEVRKACQLRHLCPCYIATGALSPNQDTVDFKLPRMMFSREDAPACYLRCFSN